ncbi:MAG: WbqC family protein [Nitrospirae bacterium]|nr:WbqC family protein [Nitrospirota bacterium]
MKIVILQPGYLPWLGFFDLMRRSDIFLIFDDVQYTVRDWRSRNRIKTPHGAMWLTVPVKSADARKKLIRDVKIDNTKPWQKKHFKSLKSFYSRAKYFKEIMELINGIYKRNYTFLIDVDMDIILKIKEYLPLESSIYFSSEIPSAGQKNEKLLSICKFLNTTRYLSGNSAKNYLKESFFTDEGITVEWHNYQHPYYNQLWLKEQGFISHLSIIDLLFNHGPESLAILAGQKVIPAPDGVKIRHADEA